MFGRTEPKPNKNGRTTEPNRTEHFITTLLLTRNISRYDNTSISLAKIIQCLLVLQVQIVFTSLKRISIFRIFQNFLEFFPKNTRNVPKSGAFVHKMFGCDRFGFFDVFGRTTEHHRTAFFRPNTETEQMFGRSLQGKVFSTAYSAPSMSKLK